MEKFTHLISSKISKKMYETANLLKEPMPFRKETIYICITIYTQKKFTVSKFMITILICTQNNVLVTILISFKICYVYKDICIYLHLISVFISAVFAITFFFDWPKTFSFAKLYIIKLYLLYTWWARYCSNIYIQQV